jgi:hypothetical protein
MMTAGAPAWGSWTTFYDPVGQAPSMARADSEDGLVVSFGMDRMQLSLQGGEDTPFTGAIGLSGALTASIPDEFLLVGFLLVVNGELSRSLGSEAVVTGSIGSATHSVEWPIANPAGTPRLGPSRTGEEEPLPEGSLLETGFSVECFTRDTRPGAVGQPPFPPLPPLPITLGMQARCRFVDEFIVLTITGFEVLILR